MMILLAEPLFSCFGKKKKTNREDLLGSVANAGHTSFL